MVIDIDVALFAGKDARMALLKTTQLRVGRVKADDQVVATVVDVMDDPLNPRQEHQPFSWGIVAAQVHLFVEPAEVPEHPQSGAQGVPIGVLVGDQQCSLCSDELLLDLFYELIIELDHLFLSR